VSYGMVIGFDILAF